MSTFTEMYFGIGSVLAIGFAGVLTYGDRKWIGIELETPHPYETVGDRERLGAYLYMGVLTVAGIVAWPVTLMIGAFVWSGMRHMHESDSL